MAELGAIVGETGSGKTTSLRNLNPAETFIINVAGKNLPFKGYKKNYRTLTQDPTTKKYEGNLYNTSNVDRVIQTIKLVSLTMPHVKQIIIDDSQYLMAFEAMDRAMEKGYEKFTSLAQRFYSVLKEAMSARDDLKIFILTHSDNVGDAINPMYKMKTIGKMVDTVITLEGLFTYVLFTCRKTNDDGVIEYKFMTNSDGTNTAKTPLGCFKELYIDNDLQMVFDRIDEYNNNE